MRNLVTVLHLQNCLENFGVSKLLMEVSKCRKIIEFSKISGKMKNFKTFYEAQTPCKNFLHLLNKNLFMEICRIIQTFASPMLRECSSSVSKNGGKCLLENF